MHCFCLVVQTSAAGTGIHRCWTTIPFDFPATLMQHLLPRPGPNSRVFRLASPGSIFVIIHLTIFLATTFSEHKGEGFLSSMGEDGVGSPTNIHGVRPKLGCDPLLSPSLVKKRSLKRAYRRAALHGYAWHRGHFLLPHQSISAPRQSRTIDSPTDHSRKRSRRNPRWTCCTWNIGGLPLDKWDGFQDWLNSQSIDIVFLQESHWKHTNEWIIPKYYCIHSGSNKPRQAGTLTLIAKHLCSQHELSWRSIIDGRLLHVQIFRQGHYYHFVNCYQHVLHGNQLTDREFFWDALHQLLGGFSHKHYIYIAGDMNTSMPTHSSVVGTASFTHNGTAHRGKAHADWTRLHDLLRDYDLTALNTWTSSTSTYSFGHQAARIDFQIVRRIHADLTSRKVVTLTHHPLVPLTGATHYPLLTTIPTHWHQYSTSSNNHHWTYKDRMQIYRHWSTHTDQYTNTINGLKHYIEQLQSKDLDNIAEIHQAFNRAAILLRNPGSSPTPQVPSTTGLFRQFSFHTDQIRRISHPTLGSFFQAWFHVGKRQHYRKLMNLHSHQNRKFKLQCILQHARNAAFAHDHRQLYTYIRKLAPKAPFRRVFLRGEDGWTTSQCGALSGRHGEVGQRDIHHTHFYSNTNVRCTLALLL